MNFTQLQEPKGALILGAMTTHLVSTEKHQIAS